MKKISREELNEMLVQHELWLNNEGGEQLNLEDVDLNNADLRNADLRNANLKYANLECVNLMNANLECASLECASLRNANLECANLECASLECANLEYANLTNTNLEYAHLRSANLEYAKLRYAKLRYANLRNADLRYADLGRTNLECVKTNHLTIGYHLACPEEGSFIGYKKAKNCLIKLLILEDSKRSSATSIKCRCDKAKVLDIINLKTDEKIDRIESDYDSNFVYKVGEIVQVDDFDENRWNECTTGIHFFMNKENAIEY